VKDEAILPRLVCSMECYTLSSLNQTVGGEMMTEGKVWEPIELIDAELDVVAGGQAIIPFKQHKDGPTQIPTGTPISLEFIAAALLFLPTINS
jgi:hypothetical protein